MSRRSPYILAGLCGLTMFALGAMSSGAQSSEVKEKAPMYIYVANWQIPRAHWGDMTKANSADTPILEKALADGTIVGYGNDENLVHEAEGETHDNWWASTSMGGIVKVLDQFYASPNTTSDTLASATKHWDEVLVSRYYNWHPGSYKNAYLHVSLYKLKADAPDDAVSSLSKNIIAPLLEKLLADGTILEYEIDTMAIHTEAPGTFAIVYVTSKPEGLDAVLAAITDAGKTQQLQLSAFGSMTESSGHRDELLRGEGKYK